MIIRNDWRPIIGLSDQEWLICARVGPKSFYRELRELGYSPNTARATLKMLAGLYFADPLLFASKNRATVKAAVTYATAVYLYFNHKLDFGNGEPPTQTVLARKFGVKNSVSLYGGERKQMPGFPRNVRALYHKLMIEHRGIFPKSLGGTWPDWVDDFTFRTNKWIHHRTTWRSYSARDKFANEISHVGE